MYSLVKVRENWRWLRCTPPGVTLLFFCVTSLPFLLHTLLSQDWYRATSSHRIIVSSCFSAFMSLIQGHLKVSNHLSFSSLLNPGQSGTRQEPRATWHLVAIFHSLCFSAHLSLLYDILDTHANSCGYASCPPSNHCTWTCLLLACHPCNLSGTLVREQPMPCLL